MRKEIRQIRNAFQSFQVDYQDNTYISLSKKGVGGITASITFGSLGDYACKFVVEKPGKRAKLFYGKNPIPRIKKYLQPERRSYDQAKM